MVERGKKYGPLRVKSDGRHINGVRLYPSDLGDFEIRQRDKYPDFYETMRWETFFALWPRPSCVEGHAWGHCVRRKVVDKGYPGWSKPTAKYCWEYASKKDAVILKIKGDPYEKKD